MKDSDTLGVMATFTPEADKASPTSTSEDHAFTAATQAFAIPELLEMILLKLPPRTSLLSQRVSKEWQAAMLSSIRIQQMLFFKPLPGDAVNPEEVLQRHGSIFHNTLLEPLLWTLNEYDVIVEDQPETAFENLLRSRLPKWGDAGKSWRRTISVHPIIKSPFTIKLLSRDPTGSYIMSEASCKRQTMGEIWDEALELVSRHAAMESGERVDVYVDISEDIVSHGGTEGLTGEEQLLRMNTHYKAARKAGRVKSAMFLIGKVGRHLKATSSK